jgi:hypothetical protein
MPQYVTRQQELRPRKVVDTEAGENGVYVTIDGEPVLEVTNEGTVRLMYLPAPTTGIEIDDHGFAVIEAIGGASLDPVPDEDSFVNLHVDGDEWALENLGKGLVSVLCNGWYIMSFYRGEGYSPDSCVQQGGVPFPLDAHERILRVNKDN